MNHDREFIKELDRIMRRLRERNPNDNTSVHVRYEIQQHLLTFPDHLEQEHEHLTSDRRSDSNGDNPLA